MSKFCANCGTPYQSDAKFCNNCGQKKPPTTEKEIKVNPNEAKEIATQLVFSAGALFLEDENSKLSTEENQTVTITVNFLEKLFKVFPNLHNEDWIGYSEHEKIKNYIKPKPKNETQNPAQPAVSIEKTEPLNSTETKPTKSSTQIDEPIKSTIIGVRTVFPEIHYILYLTDRRIIGARKDRFDSAMDSGAAVGGILGAIVGAGVDAVRGPKHTTQDKLEDLTPSQILAYDEQNWEIPYNELVEVELKKPGFLQDGEIILKDHQRKLEWIFDVDKEEFQTVINMFQEVVPTKIKVK